MFLSPSGRYEFARLANSYGRGVPSHDSLPLQERHYADAFDVSRATLLVSGTVAEEGVDRLAVSVRRHSEESTRDLVVNLSDVDLLPSAAISVLAVALVRARESGARLELVSQPASSAFRVLQICGLPVTSL